MPPLWAIALMGSAAWIWWRKRQGLPILPGKVPHVVVMTSSGPALVPATTNVVPLDPNHPAGANVVTAALSLAQASSIHAPRYIRPAPTGMGGADQGVMGAFDPFDPYSTAPSSLHVDEYGVLRSSFTRPFYAR